MAPIEHKALVLDTPESTPVVKTRRTPKPKLGEVLAKVEATALNPVDWKLPAYKLTWTTYPAIVGTDAAGEVVEVGEGVTSLKPGDKMHVLSRISSKHRIY